MKKRQDLTATAALLRERTHGSGRGIDYHLLEGSAVYSAVFAAMARLIEKHRCEPFWVFRREVERLARAPNRSCAYALWKFESEDYFHTSGSKVMVTQEHITNWEELCQRIQSRLEEKN